MRLFIWKMVWMILCISSCTHSSEKKSSLPDSMAALQIKEKKFFSGYPDIPADSLTITTAGIGPILLGDSLEKLEQAFPITDYTVSKVTSSEDGKEWPALKVSRNNHYVIAECANTVNIISVLRTNDPGYKTMNGIHAGMALDSLTNLNDSIYSDAQHRTLMYGRSGVWFKIDNTTERRYFLKGLNKEALKGGKIEELIIFCGDC